MPTVDTIIKTNKGGKNDTKVAVKCHDSPPPPLWTSHAPWNITQITVCNKRLAGDFILES